MAPNPQQHGLPPRPPGGPHANGAARGATQRSPLPDYGRSPTPGTPSRTTRRPGTFEFNYFTPAQLEAISKRQGTRASGWDAEKERKRRRGYVSWINAMCKSLGLPHVVIETAVVYMHRYYAFKSMADTDIWLMGLAAIFAACKSEDNPRALQDIIYHGLRPERVGETLKPHRPKLFERTKADEKLMKDLREWVLTAERALLYTLGFNFAIRHPQVTLLNVTTEYDLDKYSHLAPPRPGTQADVILSQSAVSVCNLVQHTTLSLQYPARTIGIGCLYFVCKEIKCEPMVNGKPWWVDAGAREQDLEDIRQQLADLLNGHSVMAEAEGGGGGDAAGGQPLFDASTDGQSAPAKGAADSEGEGGAAVLRPEPGALSVAAPEALRPADEAGGGSTSPMETRSDASDTTGAGRQGSPAAGGRGFSPVVEGRASGFSGSKRPSPDVLDGVEPPPAKRPALAAEAASKPPVDESAIAEEAAKHSVLGPSSEQPHAARANGKGAASGMGLVFGQQSQQATGAADARAAGGSDGLAAPTHPVSDTAQPLAGSAVERPTPLSPGEDTGGKAGDEPLMSQDSVEPGELV